MSMTHAPTSSRRLAPALGACAALLAGALGSSAPASAAPVAAHLAPAAAGTHAVAPTASFRWWRMPVLEYGARGAAVKVLQRRLGVVPVSGWYGPITLRKVKAFQRSQGLRSAGYVGPLTWHALSKVRSQGASRSAPRTAAVSGKVCPAPGAAFGQGWHAPRPGHLHQGMDLFDSRGSRIRAVESGYVVREGRMSNGALRIVLQGRSGAKYFYGHMDRDLVRDGERVVRGQTIGLMGDTGSPGAVHLHFEYWPSGRESAAVDPAPLLRALCR
jgi:murein DD-endopeptidase MepM/ murein hydrolase activator NlpD